MKKIGFLQDEVTGIYKLIASVLHLGNVEFADTFRNGMDTVMIEDKKGSYFALLLLNDF